MIHMEDTEIIAPSWLEKAWKIFIKNPGRFIPGILVIGFVLRVFFIPNPSFEADISFWKSWGLAVLDHDIVWSIKNTNNNYPTAFAYVLGLMAWTYSLFADPHNFREFWSNTNILFLTIAKIPSIISDFGLFFVTLWLGKKSAKLATPQLPYFIYVLAASVFLLNPITIMDGAWWGQVDSLGVFVFMIAVVLALKRHPYLAGFVFMASMMTKLQNMVYGPVFFLFLWQISGFNGIIRAVFGAITAFIGLNYEFFLKREMKLVFEQLTVNYDYFPFMSLNAYNLWWIVAKGNGMYTLDKFTVLGITNAKTVGLFIFSSFYLLSVVIMIRETIIKMIRHNLDFSNTSATDVLYRFFTAMIIVNSAFFLFQTESHDRYAFPIVYYLPIWFIFFFNSALTKVQKTNIVNTSIFKISAISFLLFTIFYFLNLHTAMADNYPRNVFQFLHFLNHPAPTIGISVVQLGLFGAFLIAASRHYPKALNLAPMALITVLLALHNLPLLTKSPVPITKFFPIIHNQGYLTRQTNMPVNASLGFNHWSPLSVQYAFYRTGYGTHAKSYQQYNIAGKFQRLTTDYGIDTEAGNQGSATFEVYADDKLLFKSDEIGRYDMPRHIELDIAGVKMLGLVTNDAGDGVNDDHTDWLNTKLWP